MTKELSHSSDGKWGREIKAQAEAEKRGNEQQGETLRLLDSIEHFARALLKQVDPSATATGIHMIADVILSNVAALRSRPVSAAPADEFPVSPAPNDYGRKEGNSMPKDYDGFRQGMLRAAEMARNEFKRAPEATKGHDCVYMSGYEDACDHPSVVIAQVAVIDSVRIAGAQPDWQYHIGLLLPEGIEDEALLKVFQVVEHELRRAATTSPPAAQPDSESKAKAIVEEYKQRVVQLPSGDAVPCAKWLEMRLRIAFDLLADPSPAAASEGEQENKNA